MTDIESKLHAIIDDAYTSGQMYGLTGEDKHKPNNVYPGLLARLSELTKGQPE